MKKIIILLIYLIMVGLITGCVKIDNIEKETENPIYTQKVEYSNSMETESPKLNTSDNTGNTIVTKSMSQDGQYVISSEVNETQGVYKVVLSNGDGNKVLNSFNIVGNNYSYLWSPDNKKVCVSYAGRIWGDFSIVDASSKTLIEHPTIKDIMSRFKAKIYRMERDINNEY